jgi:glucosyl-3-phosphoglycerate phosphatase
MGKLYLVRHAKTFYNQAQADYEAQNLDLSAAPFRWDPELCDAQLSPIGISQSHSAVSTVHGLEISKVFVSPLRRALETCKILFSNHPMQPKIIVHPILHEVLHNGHDLSCYNSAPFSGYEEFDWGLMGNVFLPELFMHEKFKGEIQDLGFVEKRAKVLEMMRRENPEFLESVEELFERAQKSKEIWRTEMEVGSVALVTHSSFLLQFTKERFEDPGIWLENCQVIDYKI